ncbi:MAG: Tellurite resistance protein TehB [uncultured Thiotrichaceae bacterium]|uniref:Tellurite resistance protein TehB n=1 Tax=uncultured Thiotrichaceae bacterium TaxID=298394 RepID=A0A6S6UAD6_9GAMM|nr:MAG: Tellurite resistance protein TehB [uncultured Thiotrichaceae bacterium]
MWDKRYATDEYAYGTEPNDFLHENSGALPSGKVLCLAEGEGRNAVWLAQQGYDVTAVDSSEVGLQKAEKLAAAQGVSITTHHADLADYDMGSAQWDGIVSIFCHLPAPLRKSVHQRCVEGLRAGGVLLLEAYTPDQLNYNTGGPPAVDMLMDSELLENELNQLTFLKLEERVRDIHEGSFHHGAGAVVQLIAKKGPGQK